MVTKIEGVLEIDHERGVIYFHITNVDEIWRRGVPTALRISGVPAPIPPVQDRMLDLRCRRADD